MSLATRCAACGTVFRVVQDQLKVSEGWVRCGRCAEVFNALEGLFDLERENAPAWTPSQRGALELLAAGGGNHVGAAAPAEADDPHHVAQDRAPGDAAGDTQIDTRADSQLDTRAAERSDIDGYDNDAEVFFPQRGDQAEVDDPSPAFPESPATSHDPSDPQTTPAFLRQAERARWHTPGARAGLAACSLFLVALLGTQATLMQRDALAARWPAAAPWIAALCTTSGCRVEPLRRLDKLTVESSGLTQLDNAALVRLQVALRNRDTMPLLTPALDLSLTDGRGQVVVRKVLTGSDFAGAVPLRLMPGSELNLQAVLDTGDRRVSGYSVEIFYP